MSSRFATGWRRWAATAVAVTGVAGLSGCVASSDVRANTSQPGDTATPTALATDPGTDVPRWVDDGGESGFDQSDTSMTVLYADGVVTFALQGPAGCAYQVDVWTTGGLSVEKNAFSITCGTSGEATFEVPVTVDASRRGSVGATFKPSEDYPEMWESWDLWFEPTNDGGMVQGSFQLEAQVKAIDHDSATEEERQEALEELQRLGSETLTTFDPGSSTASP